MPVHRTGTLVKDDDPYKSGHRVTTDSKATGAEVLRVDLGRFAAWERDGFLKEDKPEKEKEREEAPAPTRRTKKQEATE